MWNVQDMEDVHDVQIIPDEEDEAQVDRNVRYKEPKLHLNVVVKPQPGYSWRYRHEITSRGTHQEVLQRNMEQLESPSREPMHTHAWKHSATM